MFRIVVALALICSSWATARRGPAWPAPQTLGGRPPCCPHAFCGCGASLYLFGRNIPRLNLAAAWLAFPRAGPAPRMAAVRRHHGFVLVEQPGAGVWLAHEFGRNIRKQSRFRWRSRQEDHTFRNQCLALDYVA
ncbi:hypothetical protein HAP48_0037555 [Bradyrhizobium septentrionale]|uniref:Uncharacterized protein n=1 Tax=Bradyrhizobium septentrionale TaxID=1404411 RepID=A0A974A1T5_9BRAD|nr:hypothetical protein [Bradyrhizobium septentrionale]UGY14224.1 hypothetical protein HAP48_0037555 [Bradyrhizobium septentrionale]